MANYPTKFQGKYVIEGKIRCVTGLHIGGSDTGIEIGGLDNPVIKDPLTDRPYIPGSSLKGKLRVVTEWTLGLIALSESQRGSFAAYDCRELLEEREKAHDKKRWEQAYILGRLFGPGTAKSAEAGNIIRMKAGPTRLTVRDAFLNEESSSELEDMQGTGVFTEVKTENTLDRVTSEANPRPLERVPAGADFDFTLLLDIYDEEDRKLLQTLFAAMALVEDSTLGGGGSRGHGQIAFRDLSVTWRPVSYYTQGKGSKEIPIDGKKARALAAEFDPEAWK